MTVTPTEMTRVTVYIVPSEHSDQEDRDHMSTCETDPDGYNLTASHDSDTDSETEVGGMKQKMDKFGINYPLL